MTSSRSTARRILSGALISLLTIAGLAVAAPASAETISLTVSGTVLDSHGVPVTGESVSFYSNVGFYSAPIDDNGAFSVTVEYDSSELQILYSVQWTNGAIDIASLEGATETTLSIVVPATITITIQGVVTDYFGTPLAGTAISAWSNTDWIDTTSDASGFYSMTISAIEGMSVMIQTGNVWNPIGVIATSDGEVIIQDIVMGHGAVYSIELNGVLLDTDGVPVPYAMVAIGTDIDYYMPMTDENGAFSQQIEYSEFGWVSIWATSAGMSLDVPALMGQTSTSVIVQQMPPAHVTVSGHVYDENGSPIANAPVVVYGVTEVYTFTDETGFYSLETLQEPFASFSIATDGMIDPLTPGSEADGAHITIDLVNHGSDMKVYVSGPVLECDVDGDGFADMTRSYQALATGENEWHFELGEDGWGWGDATFGQGDLAEAYCADLNGDGASEVIARAETSTYHPRTDKTTIQHTWWIYEYTTGTVTEQSFGRGEIEVYFENLDATPGVELIVTRTDTVGADKWWILDDPASTVETFKLGFVSEGTLAFEDVNDVAGVEIVTSITKPNGNVKVEYYTRASGVGSIVKYTVE